MISHIIGGGGGRGLGLARGPGNGTGLSGTGGTQARGEPGEITFVVDGTNRELDVKLRIACGGCGMPAHPPEECVLRKGRCHSAATSASVILEGQVCAVAGLQSSSSV